MIYMRGTARLQHNIDFKYCFIFKLKLKKAAKSDSNNKILLPVLNKFLTIYK